MFTICYESFVLAASYSPLSSTIATTGLNFWVRNGTRCGPCVLTSPLRKNKQKYFTFLNHSGIPIDNNKAERALRHLGTVAKLDFWHFFPDFSLISPSKNYDFLSSATVPSCDQKKISFGSKTQRGAETTGILASVILSLKWNDPHTWFQKYLKLGT